MASPVFEDLHVLIIGATGLVGTHFLREAQNSILVKKITVLSRRDIPLFHNLDKVHAIIETDTLLWSKWIQDSSQIDVVFSALGTTRGDSGSISEQRTIDYDLNLMVAQQSKLKGAKVFTLVSSFNNAAVSKFFHYFALKQQVEGAITSLLFDATIILRPGPLVGDRSSINSQYTLRSFLSSLVATYTYNTPLSCLVGGTIKAEEVAEVAMFMIETSRHLKDVRVVTSREMLQLGDAVRSL
jgi:uncharacterized protein YbjT (DUF2867 family)